MSEGTDHARTTQTDVPARTTIKGRSFGNISYAAEEAAPVDDLRRRTTSAMTAEVGAPRLSHEQRDTGARKRVRGA